MATATDVEARKIATQALSRIESHEEECTRRYIESATATRELRDEVRAGRAEVRSDVITLHQKVDAIQRRNFAAQVTVLVAIVGLLLSMVAYFVTAGRPWQPKPNASVNYEELKNG